MQAAGIVETLAENYQTRHQSARAAFWLPAFYPGYPFARCEVRATRYASATGLMAGRLASLGSVNR
jgi:hypothetical protein